MKKFVTLVCLAVICHSSAQSYKIPKMVHVNGIEMHYEVYGKGEPLLLLHGWTQSLQFWSDFIPAYAKHFRVYAIDLRGHGRTSSLTDDFTIKKTSEDILALLEKLRIKKAKAIGLSFGGLTLLELAASQPEKLESMILIGVSQSYDGSENNSESFSFENLPASFVQELEGLHHYGENQIRAMFNPNLNYQIDLSDEEVNAIKSETLIVHGDRDEILGINPAITLHKKLSNSALWIIPNTGHLAITDINQDDFIKKSIWFLTKNEVQKK